MFGMLAVFAEFERDYYLATKHGRVAFDDKIKKHVRVLFIGEKVLQILQKNME